MHNPQIYLGDKAAISTKTPEEFPLIISVFIGTGEHLWCSFHTIFASPPDKSGGYAKEILTGFLLSNLFVCIRYKLRLTNPLHQIMRKTLKYSINHEYISFSADPIYLPILFFHHSDRSFDGERG